MALLIATGIFKTKPPLYYLRAAQGFTLPMPTVYRLEKMLGAAVGLPVRLKFDNLRSIQDYDGNKVNANSVRASAEFMRRQQEQLAKTKGARSGPPIESALEKKYFNPLEIRDMIPRLKAHSKLVYSLDIFMVTLHASQYNGSNLLADVLVRSLLRNMKSHKQVLSLVEATIEYIQGFSNGPFKPTDGRIAVQGKLGGGSIRSRTQYIQTGYLPLQTIMTGVDYTYRVAETKFGAIGVKVGLRSRV